MQPIRSYVVRIYRQDREGLAGVVEDVKTGQSRPFHSVTELWTAFSGRWTKSRRKPAPTPDALP
ncbi:hypothetical protein [Arenimonas oryziterrae]|uniref:Uncharacterized protein n=1 Tax=Arenimonas oryziterrae DSM 21050 = YC6267 TaxID=1121015 RepID=A0A091AXR3_9GAMM|nr:hypothetical protein [Arenimonas oryziterrae]KFN44246.1 hypothetical protein N789_07450 [Arenimonas oryziterrae DSM 21050 = YC6267]